MTKWIEPGTGVEFHLCIYCDLPVEPTDPVPGGNNFVCTHRPRLFGGGHRAHALCCANHLRGRVS